MEITAEEITGTCREVMICVNQVPRVVFCYHHGIAHVPSGYSYIIGWEIIDYQKFSDWLFFEVEL